MESTSIGEGIYQIPSLGYSNAYLFETAPKSYLLVDTGTSSGGSRILKYLEITGRTPSMISEIILTHTDSDHSGSAANLKKASSAKLAVHEKDAPRISGQVKKIKETNGFGNVLMSLVGIFMKVERIQPDVILKDGDSVGPLTVIFTPGHTDGSSSFLFKSTLFTGDTLFAGSVGGAYGDASTYEDILNSVKSKIFTLPDDTVLMPGHGPPSKVEWEKAHNPFF